MPSRPETLAAPLDQEIAKTWIAGLKAKSRKTATAYTDAINGFLTFVDKPVPDITAEDVAAYISHVSVAGPARPAVSHQVSAVRSFLRHCRGLGIIGTAPIDALNGDKTRAGSMNQPVRTDEVERFLSAAKDLVDRHPLGRLGRTSVVLGVALPFLLWILSDEKTVLGSLVLLVTLPLWMGAVRSLLYIGQWMLTEPQQTP